MITIAFVTNKISAALLYEELKSDKIVLSNTYIISARYIETDWLSEFAEVHMPKREQSFGTSRRYIDLLAFYYHAACLIKRWTSKSNVSNIFIANVENIIGNHLLRWGEMQDDITVSVLVEGNMNFHNVTASSRAQLTWFAKKLFALFIGLYFSKPTSHLSGSYEHSITKVISYTHKGLQAPKGKVSIIPFPPVKPNVLPDPNSVLVLLPTLNLWMSTFNFDKYQKAFGEYINSLHATKVLIKPHPNYHSGGLENNINHFEWFNKVANIEEIIDALPAKTVIGSWSTGLITIKLMRPDITCIDFGSNFYAKAAFDGDSSIFNVLNSANVQIVEM